MATSMTLAPNMTRDPKLHRHPQAIIKANAGPNTTEMSARAAFDRDEALYSLDPLEGEMGDAKILLAEGDVAYIMVEPGYGEPVNTERNFMNQDNRIKVLTLLNGLKKGEGNTEQQIVDAMLDNIEPVGFIEQGNEENRSAQTNVLRGGSFTVLYNGTKGVRQNAWLTVCVPTPDEADKMKTDKASHARGRRGAVPLMFKEYNPHSTTYLSLEKLSVILGLNGETKHGYTKKSAEAAQKFVEALAQFGEAFATEAAAKGYDKFSAGMSSVDVVKEMISDAVDDPEHHVDFISGFNGVVQAQASARLGQERLLVGKAQHAARNGNYLPMEGVRYAF